MKPIPWTSILVSAVLAYAQTTTLASTASIPKTLRPLIFTAFDLETTGLSSTRDRVIEIAAVKFTDGCILESRQWLINPGQPIPPGATRIHGLTDADVCDAPVFSTVYPQFLAFVTNTILVAHNAPFDTRFLVQETTRNNLPTFSKQVIDSLPIARKALPQKHHHDLRTLAIQFNIDTKQSHRSLNDSLTLARVFSQILQQLPPSTTLTNLAQVADSTFSH